MLAAAEGTLVFSMEGILVWGGDVICFLRHDMYVLGGSFSREVRQLAPDLSGVGKKKRNNRRCRPS